MIQSIAMRNVLSFGDNETMLDLGPLTVLIGPNGAGKSNVLEVMYLLSRLTATGLDAWLPIEDWIWKGLPPDSRGMASIEVRLGDRRVEAPRGLTHQVQFREVSRRFYMENERIQSTGPLPGHSQPFIAFKYEQGKPTFSVIDDAGSKRIFKREDLDRERSVVAQRADPERYPEIELVRRSYESIRLFRDLNFGPTSPTRRPQATDLPTHALREDGSNLALVLNRLKQDVNAKREFLRNLQRFYEPARDINVSIEGGTAQIFIEEENWVTPATRLSDGTMRWLSMLAVLLDPKPPMLVCFDEPDLGLHPDCVSALADLLIAASERMQVVITTHSDVLIDALGDRPEAVVVCEKQGGATNLRRLDRNELAVWLEKYSLGELYSSGQLGGRRW